MEYVVATILTVGLLFSICSAGEKIELKEQKDKESYSLGYQFGQSVELQGIDLNFEGYTSRIRDALGGIESQMSSEEIRATITSLQQRLMAVRQKLLAIKSTRGTAE